MRSLSGSSITTFLMFVPLLAVPLLAIFGIPEFSPVNASPSGDENRVLTVTDRGPAVGQSEKHSPDDLFAEVENRTGFAGDFKRLDVERREDPFQSNSSNRTAAKSQSGEPANAGNSRLAGWKVDANRRRSAGAMKPQVPATTREPIAHADTSSRNPFAAGSGRISKAVAPRRGRPNSFEEFVKSREEANGRSRGTQPNRSISSSAKQSPSGSLLSVPPESTGSPDRLAATTKATPAGRLTWRSAVKRLNSLGIRDFRLQPGRRNGEFHFSCTFTPHQGTRVTHRFEAEDSEPLKAVGQVIAQIESWLRRR